MTHGRLLDERQPGRSLPGLTGMGEDGTQGAAALKDRGAMIIAQDEASSVVWGMPGSAYRAGVVDRLVPLSVLPETITEIINRIPHG